MAMATDRPAVFAVPAAAAFLLWPALWNGYPIVFADTGTYLSQAIHLYAGWDRPVFYSLFMLPLHAMVTLWPVVIVQALLATWVLWLVSRVLVPGLSGIWFVVGVAVLSVVSWLPWIASELMPDLFTPLLVLVLCLLAWVPERLSPREQAVLVALSAFMIASQQSSLPLACVLVAVLGVLGRFDHAPSIVAGARPIPVRQTGRRSNVRPAALSPSSWPGVSRPSTPDRWCADGRDAPGHDDREEPAPQNQSPLSSYPDADGDMSGHDGESVKGPAKPLSVRHFTLMRPGTRPAMTVKEDVCIPPTRYGTTRRSRPAIARQTATCHPSRRRRGLLLILPPALAIAALCTVNLAAHGRFAISPFGNVFLLARV
ncbi:MAG: hypothetical protein P4L90_03925, partial [Rhodopila sp.]|nr:hypothetical protein [Rhodopila sp.]